MLRWTIANLSFLFYFTKSLVENTKYCKSCHHHYRIACLDQNCYLTKHFKNWRNIKFSNWHEKTVKRKNRTILILTNSSFWETNRNFVRVQDTSVIQVNNFSLVSWELHLFPQFFFCTLQYFSSNLFRGFTFLEIFSFIFEL